MSNDLRYPIGKSSSVRISPQERIAAVQGVAELPQKLRDALNGWHGRRHTPQIATLRERMGW